MDVTILNWIIVIALLILMLGGTTWILFERYKREKGIGVRVIQFLAIILLIPSIVILGLNGILSSDVIATLLGTIIGYLFSGINKDEKN